MEDKSCPRRQILCDQENHRQRPNHDECDKPRALTPVNGPELHCTRNEREHACTDDAAQQDAGDQYTGTAAEEAKEIDAYPERHRACRQHDAEEDEFCESSNRFHARRIQPPSRLLVTNPSTIRIQNTRAGHTE